MSLVLARRNGMLMDPRRQYHQQQLVKRRPGSNIRMIVSLPTSIGHFPQRDLQRHVPKFMYDLRESGNRVSMPLEHFRPSFRNINDEPAYAFALEWVFARVEEYATRFGAAPDANSMQDLLQQIDTAYQMGDGNAVMSGVEDAQHIFDAISNVIRPDKGFDYSNELFIDFLEAARDFIPYFSVVDPGMGETFMLLLSVYTASAQNLGPIELLTRSIQGNQRQLLQGLVHGMANNGDILAREIWANGFL